MKPFDLKKYLTENKATFHAALNEARPGYKPEIGSTAHKYYKDAEADDAEHIKALEKDMKDDKEASKKASKKLKESKLRSKIREMILAEMALDIDNMEDAPESEVDFLSELESMLDEEIPYINPEADEIDDEDLEAASDYFDLLREKKDEKQTDEETTDDITDEEEVDTTIDVDTDEVDPNVKAVQDALTQAQAAAQSLGDQKLSNQIGNTITYFTRAHISKPNNLR